MKKKPKHRADRKLCKTADQFTKGKGRECRLTLTRRKQSRDHTRRMRKTKFGSSFKVNIYVCFEDETFTED